MQLFIGEESGYKVLDEYSVVTAPYRLEGEMVGAICVIGPTRMAYERDLRRARWIFERVFGVEVVHFEVSPDPADDPALPALRAHEPSSLAWYRDRWEELHAASCARWATTVQGGP